MPSFIPLQQLIDLLGIIFPSELAEEWDNVGFLIGDRNRSVSRVMTCLTIDSEVVAEAAEREADIIISHHPFPFRKERRWTLDTQTGRILLGLVQNNIAVYSPHTANDSALWGINRQLAALLGLTDVRPLIPGQTLPTPEMLTGLTPEEKETLASEMTLPLGTGRIGNLPFPCRLGELLEKTVQFLNVSDLTWVGDQDQIIRTAAVACGAADDFVRDAIREKADLLLLGETRFHIALEAQEAKMALILPGHYATERFAMEKMAARLTRLFPELEIWPSKRERDPIQFFPKK